MTEPSSKRPFFETRDGLFVPTGLAGSPWGPGQLNGVAVGMLLAQTMIEAHPPEGMNIARFNFDILGRAPMAPLAARWRMVREGRRQAVLEGVLSADGVDVAKANALFVRRADEGAPATVFAPPTPQPDEVLDAPLMMPLRTGLESRLIQRGKAGSDQPLGRVWVRPLTPAITGAEIHPIIAAVAAADFAGGLSAGLDRAAWLSPNVDIALQFVRPPRDAWVLVESETLLAGNGSGLVDARLSDRHGPFGRAHQVLAVSPVPRARAEAGA
jgi:hypothetical protein